MCPSPPEKNAAVPAPVTQNRVLGLHKSRAVVFKLSALFALDAFAGGLIVQSMFALWLYVRFGVEIGRAHV